ncbi:Pyridine nucleotide-disulfide oxidoreductase domain-containing protein [Trichinella pseudospiralis]
MCKTVLSQTVNSTSKITTTATTTPATATKKHLASSDSLLLGRQKRHAWESARQDTADHRHQTLCSVPKSTRPPLSAGNVSIICRHKQPYTTSTN